MSAKVPPTRVIGAEKAMPSSARQTSNVSMFFATAQGMTRTVAINRVEPLPNRQQCKSNQNCMHELQHTI
jgi:hypothetical protein